MEPPIDGPAVRPEDPITPADAPFCDGLGCRGVTVNAVAPGWIVTEMARTARSEEEFEAQVRNMSERAMVG
jgi:hypothetical protein